MTGLLRSELLKITSIRSGYGLAAGALAYVTLSVVALVFAAGQPGVPPLTDPAQVRNVFASSGSASALVLVLGILGMTTEYRHQTVTPTFLVTPRRARVLAAKLVVNAFAGLVLGVACSGLAFALGAACLALRAHAPVNATSLVQILGATVLAYAIYAVVGVCVGALVRNQVAAIVAALLWTLIAEALAVALLPSVGRWLPGGALAGVLRSQPRSSGNYLPVWAGALVLLGYAAVFALLATRTTLRRDVT